MSAGPGSWSRPAESARADPSRATLVAVGALALFIGAWTLLHVGFYRRDQIVDTPIYQRYGDAIAGGQVPYRDFRLEYPPGALPVFALPSVVAGTDDFAGYRRAFEVEMWLAGVAMLAFMAAALAALRAGERRVTLAVSFAALAPLALGSLVLSRFDLWPATITAAALAALLAGRGRLGLGVLGVATATKIYPAVLLPLALTHVWRCRGRREALTGLGMFLGAVCALYVPFAALSPDGVAWSLGRQLSRPLQIESLGSAVLLAGHQVLGFGLVMRSGHGSQNLAGTAPALLAALLTLIQAAALLGIWVWYARGPADRERLVRACAAAVCAFVALGKVFSPQFLVWLVALVPLVAGRRGVRCTVLLALAAVLTQLWFPFRYWDLALRFDALASWLVLARDLVMLVLLAALLWPDREPRTAVVGGTATARSP